MFRHSTILFLISVSLLFIPLQSNFYVQDTSGQNSVTLQAKITKLSVTIQSSNTLIYDIVIQTYNPSNSNVTLNHDSWCGFTVMLDARVDAFYNTSSGYSICNTPFGTFPISYKPGYTNENYNATTTFDFQNRSLADLPIGFYYFDIITFVASNPAVSPLGALFLYYGNGNSKTYYNVNTSYSDRPQYDSPLIPQELSSYSQSLQASSQPFYLFPSPIAYLLLIIPIAVLIILLTFLFSRRKKTLNYDQDYVSEYKENNDSNLTYGESNPTYSESTFTTTIQKEETKDLLYCHNCHSQVGKKDIFCNNCGSRLQ